MTEKYRFTIDDRPAGPIREQWSTAAQDAVNAGYATWRNKPVTVALDANQGAAIERIHEN